MAVCKLSAEPMQGRVRPELAILSSLGEHLVGNYVLVRIADDSGHEGLGEASVTSVWSGETQAGAIGLIRDFLAPLVMGADPFDLPWIMRRIDRAAHANSFAKAAIECALLDLQARILDVPLHRLLGGVDRDGAAWKQGIRLKFVIGKVAPALAAERAARMVAAGWNAIKIKVGHDPAEDIDRVRAVRAAIGPDVLLTVDANGGYRIHQAREAAKGFADCRVLLFEQPTPRGDHRAMATVRRDGAIPVMADESIFTHADALEAIRCESADILSLYPGKHGGIRASQEIARMAESAGMACTIGSNLEREIATAAMAHLAISTPNIQCERFPGDLIGPLYFDTPFTKYPLSYAADRLRIPSGPGLGVCLETGRTD